MSRRIRTLKPEIIEDEKVGPLTDSAFRLFASMITMADDWGNLRGDIRWLQGQVWWAHESPPNVLLALVELNRASLVDVYAVRGGTYIHLRGWEKHQRIDNAGKGTSPVHKDADALLIDLNGRDEEAISRRVAASLREPPRLAAGSGEEGKGEDLEAAARPLPSKPKRLARVACLLPADWSPRSEEREKAVGTGLNCDAEVESFRDHHTARGNRYSDWDAAFRQWLRNAVKFASNGRQGTLTPRLASPRKMKDLS